jgi:hypothetical protein
VPISADVSNEGREEFTLVLSGSSGPGLVRAVGTGRIFDRGFYTVAPCRLVDTRVAGLGAPALAGNTPDSANFTRHFAFGSKCGLPATAKAAFLTVTVTEPTALGNLRLWAADTPAPLASTVNWNAGSTRAGNAIVPLSSLGQIAVTADGGGYVHLILDVTGYFE